MAQILKQSTSVDVRIGPFVDVGDGFTPETGVTIAASDEAEILKANGAATVAMTGAFTAVAGCDGWYDYTLAAGDVDTVGDLVIVMQDDSVYLPVFARFQVVEEAIYDALFAASAAGFDANQRVDVGSWLGTAAATPTVGGVPEVDITHWRGSVPNALLTGRLDSSVGAMAAGVLTAAALATDAADEIADHVWDELMAGHVAADSAGLVMNDWQDGGRLDLILDARMAEASINTTGGAVDTVTAVTNAVGITAAAVDAVWDEDIVAAHGTASTAGLLLRALGATISARSNNATLDALLGVADVASRDIHNQLLLNETLSELAVAAPAATPSLSAALMLMYMALRNQETATATARTIRNDAGTIIATAVLSDDATTFTKGEFA